MISNDRSPIAIIAALEREIAPLVRDWARHKLPSGVGVFIGPSAVAIAAGIGPNAASATCKALLEEFSPSLFVSVGLAGAISSSLKVGDVILPEKTINTETGRVFPVTATGPTLAGALLSSPTVLSVSQKREAAAHHHGIAVDMEAAAVAEVAASAGIPFLAVKAISDEANFEMPPFEKFVRADGTFSTGPFLASAALRPQWWPRMLRLARNSRRASEALCARLRHLIDNRQLAASAIKLNKAT
jgi:adenosylhomocysteine nucleosidase